MSDEQHNTMGPVMVCLLKKYIWFYANENSFTIGCYRENSENKVN